MTHYDEQKNEIEYNLLNEKDIETLLKDLGGKEKIKLLHLIDLLNLIKSIYSLYLNKNNTDFTSEFNKTVSIERPSSWLSNTSSRQYV